MKKMVFTFLFLITIFLYSLIFIINMQEPITGSVSEGALFDIKVEIPSQFLNVGPGKELMVEVSIFNIKITGLIDVLITHQIKDLEGNILLVGSETRSVEKQINYIKKFVIPEDAKAGKYILDTTITYNGVTANSKVQFVISRILKTFEIVTFLSIALMIIIIIIILKKIRKIKKHITLHHKNHHKKIYK